MPRNTRRHQNVNTLNHPNQPSPPAITAETVHPPPHQPPSSSLKPNPKFLSLLLQALIMAFVFSLFFIFISVATIIFLHLCVVGGALHRRRNRRRPNYGDGELPSGLSLDSIKALPKSRFTGSEICAICLENVEKGDYFRVLPSCSHVFHLKCVDKWLMKVPACPNCRRSVGLSGRDHQEANRTAVFDWDRFWTACG